MELRIKRSIIIKALENADRAIGKSPIDALQMTYIRTTDDNGLMVTGGSSEIAIRSVISPDDVEVREPGEVVIDRRFLSILKQANAEEISLKYDGTKSVLKAGRSKYSLASLDGNEYPHMTFDGENPFTVDSEKFREAFTDTAECASTSLQRPVLTGIHVIGKDGYITVAATDAYRACQVEFDMGDEEKAPDFDVLVSASAVKKLLPYLHDDVQISTVKGAVIFTTSECAIRARLIDGIFPDMSRMFNIGTAAAVSFSTAEVSAIIRRMRIILDKPPVVRLNMENMTFSGLSETGKAEEEFDGALDGEAFEIAFNADYLENALKTLSFEETLTAKFSGNMRPFILSGEHNGSTVTHVILPVRVN